MARLLRFPEVIARVGLSRSGIYARMAANAFPRAVSLGPNSVGFVEEEIDSWVDERIKAGRSDTADAVA